MHKIGLILVLIICHFSIKLNAQSKNIKSEAAQFYDAKNFKSAYDLYNTLSSENPTNLEYKFRLGYCSLFYPEQKTRSIDIFKELKELNKIDDINYYLAKAYHINYLFDEAIVMYNQFLNEKPKNTEDEETINFIKDSELGLENCKNGKELILKKVVADIKNIGPPINSDETEGVPVISADESIMIYTYSGKKSTGGLLNENSKPDLSHGSYHEDIFLSTKLNDSMYTEPFGIDALNTTGNDAAVAISPDGNTLFTFESNNNEGDLYISTLSGFEWSKPTPLNKNINSEAWEGSCSISSDGRFLYFASEKPGGFGGRDLYVSEKINGGWGPAKNLGPSINTKYDEDAPFIHADGITLYFSSEGHQSIGGYDIMFSIKKDNAWLPPISMGIPLNTTEDDRYYVISGEGERGYFSSNRPGIGGKGSQDIYVVTPGILGEKPILALLKGNVYADNKPVEAKIEVTKNGSNEAIGPYYSNSKTGKFLMALTPGDNYKVKIISSIAGYDPIEEELNIEKLQKFVELKKDFNVYSPGFENKTIQKSMSSLLDSILNANSNPEHFPDMVQTTTTAISPNTAEVKLDETKTDAMKTTEGKITEAKTAKAKTTEVKIAKLKTTEGKSIEGKIAEINDDTLIAKSNSTNPCNGKAAPDFTALKGKSLNDPAIYKKLMEVAGNICAEGLIFKVQIAAYKKPENYKYGHLSEFGKPEIIAYPDGITRFTQFQVTTLQEAEAARQKIKGKGQADAWITGFINGKRYSLEELIILDFFGKAVN